MAEKHYISVILPLKLEWDPWYWTDEQIERGGRVEVLFAGKKYIGVVDRVAQAPEIDPEKVKEIIGTENDIEKIFPEELSLWKMVADYYMCTIGEVYKAAYPTGKINMEQARAEVKRKVYERRAKTVAAITSKLEKLQSRLEKKVLLAEKSKEGTKAKSTYLAEIAKIHEEIAIGKTAKENAEKSLKAAEDGVAIGSEAFTEDSVTLTDAQERAFQEILTQFKTGKPVLLHGVTGSGKTEIYIKLAQKALREGKNALYLVPEIALSRQLEERLHEHFGDRLTVFHSGESLASRRNSTEIIRSSNYIALCTRSGLFLPHHDLGLIIVDEEHDGSYKQDSPAPRYNGRDTALMLNRLHQGCNIILGSATPSLEEIYNTGTGLHSMVRLTERYHGSEDSEIEIIDTKAERRKNGMAGSFSRKLIDRIRETIRTGGQVLILRSRRAWATSLQCTQCGEIQKCPHCNVSLNYHKNDGTMTCHYCGHKTHYHDKCVKCGGALAHLGAGTQKIEEEAIALFPEARIGRLDSDIAQNKAHEAKLIKDFTNGEIDILIGTQIITKGFDFSRLSLVAIIAADTLLGAQDFRADEKAFQLMEQFRGRCGRRSSRGTFIIQTSQPDHPIYRQLIEHHEPASTRLMQERMDFGFPPYSRIIELTVRDKYEDRLVRMAQKLAQRLDGAIGPYSPVVDKVADMHIRKLRICMKKDRNLRTNKAILKETINVFEKENRYEGHITIDVDPA